MSGPNGFTGTIQSGTANQYQVLLNNGQTVTAECLAIADTETVPVGYKVVVVLVAGTYYFQVPLWAP